MAFCIDKKNHLTTWCYSADAHVGAQ